MDRCLVTVCTNKTSAIKGKCVFYSDCNIEAEDTVTFIKDSNSSLGSNCNSVCFFILS